MRPRFPYDHRDPDLRSASLRLVALPSAVSRARHFLLAQLRSWDLNEFADDCTLVGTELITNAVAACGSTSAPTGCTDLHDRRPATITVRLRRTRARLYCEVWDRSAAPPLPRTPGDPHRTPGDPHEHDLAEGGRGLLLVAACSTDWGYVPLPATGKVVWSCWDLAVAAAGRPRTEG